jgi:hypothetical protein
VDASKVLSYPLLYWPNLEYQGAFVLSSSGSGVSSLHNAEGGMTYAPPTAGAPNGSVYVSGNFVKGGIAQFSVPSLVKSYSLNDLPVSDNILQPFTAVIDRERADLNYLSDLLWLNGSLLFSAHAYYPASDLSKHKVGIIENASNLAAYQPVRLGRGINSYSGVEGASKREAAVSAGWFSKIPGEWQAVLGGTHLFGPADGWSVAARAAPGPSVFSFTPEDSLLRNKTRNVAPSYPLVDYTDSSPLDHRGRVGGPYVNPPSDLWNSMSFIRFGFIFPRTRTLMLVGNHWGLDNDIGYKIPKPDGRPPCAGPCPFVDGDQSNYYWLLDLRDVVQAMSGRKRFDSIKPYAYGKMIMPFQQGRSDSFELVRLVGGTYDEVHNRVYFQLRGADTRPQYDQRSVFVSYSANMNTSYSPPEKPSITAVSGMTLRNEKKAIYRVRCKGNKKCNSVAVKIGWNPVRYDTTGKAVNIDHYRVHFRSTAIDYDNRKRNKRIGVSVPGDRTSLLQEVAPGDWIVTVRAITDKNIPSGI